MELFEQETIINFNKGEHVASVFTYEGTWQRHFEQKLGLKPVMDNGHGGKEYEIDKSRIRKPQLPKKMTDENRKRAAERLAKARSLSKNSLSSNKSEG